MKRFISLLIMICLLLPSFALAKSKPKEQPIPDFCKPILEAWGATNAKELAESIRTHWRENATKDWAQSLYTEKNRPLAFKLGGATQELIASHKEWDIAIVSSKEVDLQKLADEGVIIPYPYEPASELCLNHWLLPERVQKKLPVHPIYEYVVYCYDYNVQTDEAVFLICNDKHRPAGSREGWATQILKRRDINKTRALEDLCRVNDWTQEGVQQWTMEDLLEKQDDWDWACLRIDENDKLEILDQAGLLYDFSQDAYWVDREPDWDEPKGLFSADGRMIAIPYDPFVTGEYEPNTIIVFVINAKNAFSLSALEYAKHFVKSYEWIHHVVKTDWSDPDIEKKYGEHSICIYKDQVDW